MRPLPTRPEIIYSPPKSMSFGHTTAQRDAAQGWEVTKSFIQTLTQSELRPTIKLDIRYFPEHPDWCERSVMEACVNEATEKFGTPTNSWRMQYWSWERNGSLLDEAVAFALKDLARSKQKFGPTCLTFGYDFHWKKHEALPKMAQPGEGSCLGISHGGRRLFLQPTFRFPFESGTEEFKTFVSDMEPFLPFKLRGNCFRLMLPSTPGKMPRLRRTPADWLPA